MVGMACFLSAMMKQRQSTLSARYTQLLISFFLASLHTSGGEFNIREYICLPFFLLSFLRPIISSYRLRVTPALTRSLLNGEDCLEDQNA
jgi:hypothetical protein